MKYIAKEKTYWVTGGVDNKIHHYGVLEAGSHLATGQPDLRTYISRDEWLERLEELGVGLDNPILGIIDKDELIAWIISNGLEAEFDLTWPIEEIIQQVDEYYENV